jgi:hypothetical protein
MEEIQNTTSDRDLLVYLVARVSFLESTLESILTYLPSIGTGLSTQERLRHASLIGKWRGDYTELALKDIRNQFPDLAGVIEEHIQLLNQEFKVKYDPGPGQQNSG